MVKKQKSIPQNILKKVSLHNYEPYYYQITPKKYYRVGTDSVDVITKDNIRNVRYKDSTIKSIPEHILFEDDTGLLDELVDIWLGNPEHDIKQRRNLPFDVKFNLMYYMIYRKPEKKIFTDRELQIISKLSIERLTDLLGSKYKGGKDKSSLLFAAITGKSAPMPNIQNNKSRYNQVKSYSPQLVYYLLQINGYVPSLINNITKNAYPPHILLSILPKSKIEDIILVTDQNNLKYVMDYYGIVSPKQLKDENRFVFFTRELQNYGAVLNRSETAQVPKVKDINNTSKTEIFAHLTTKELLNNYGDMGTEWKNRIDLMQKINHIVNLVGWRDMQKDNCLNDRKSGKNVISYGDLSSYNCYKVSDLNQTFGYYDDVFKFINPDYDSEVAKKDPRTGQTLSEEFYVDQIENLIDNFNNINALKGKIKFRDLISEGLESVKEQTPEWMAKYLRDKFHTFDEEHVQQVKLYLIWLFTYSMYLVGWDGYASPYPVADDHPTNRDMFIQQAIGKTIRSMLSDDVLMWVDNLPVITYNYTSRLPDIHPDKLKFYLDTLELANENNVSYAPALFGTFYYYATTLFEPDVNAIIQDTIHEVVNIEWALIPDLIDKYKNEDSDIARIRMNALINADNILKNLPDQGNLFYKENMRYL